MGRVLNDFKCRVLQKAVYVKIYKGHKPNEWEPWRKPEKAEMENLGAAHENCAGYDAGFDGRGQHFILCV